MTLRIGDIAPDFTAPTTSGPVSFHEHLGESWGILFSHPADFTPICTTEIGAIAALDAEWTARDIKVLVISVDGLDDHRSWVADIERVMGLQIDFPLIADPGGVIARQYGMVHEHESSTMTVRTVFVIDPQKRVRLTLCYPVSVGRNFDEILRVVDSLRRTDAHSVATPADWTPGERVVLLPGGDAVCPTGFRTVTDYLSLVDDPGQ